jgi:hypothetical protein
MWQEGRQKISSARTPWQQALDYPGAFQAGYMRFFFDALDWQKLEPNDQVVKKGPNTNGKEIRAAVAGDGTFLVAYSPYGMDFSLDLSELKINELRAQWYNPRNNSYIQLGNVLKEAETAFDPPADPARGNDWVLLITDK